MTSAPALATGSDTAAAPVRAAWRQARFLRYLTGQAVSLLGDQVWYVALSWTAVRAGSPAVAGVLLMLSSVPRLGLMLFGGVIADRFDIRRLMIGSDVLRTIITLAAAGIALLHPGIALLAVLALAFGTADAVFMPAAGAMQPRLLQPGQYASGAAASETLSRLALSLGAPLGGILVAWGGLSLGLVVDAATFAISVATLVTVRPRPVSKAAQSTSRLRRSGYWADMREGVGFLLRHPLLGPLAVLGVLDNLGFVGPMNIGLAELASHRGWGAAGIGVLLTGFGIGAAAGAVLMNVWHIRRGAGFVVALLGVFQGGATVGMALAPRLWIAVSAAALAGICSGPMGVTSSVLNQAATPDEFRGRVTSLTTMSTYLVVLLAMSGMGLLISAVGVTSSFGICAAIEASGVLLLAAPELRHAAISG